LNRIENSTHYYFNHLYSNKGTYYYYVQAKDTSNNSIKSDVKKFVIAYKPVANFSFSPLQPTELDDITFDASSSYDTDTGGYIVNYSWDFGDGEKAYGTEVTHRYAYDGSYTVTLTVYDNDGAWDTMEKNVVVINLLPVANFSFSPLQPIVGETVHFNDSSYDLDGDVRIWRWDFGDGKVIQGSTAEYKNPSHAYTRDGVYSITLTVWDNDYDNSSITKEILVRDIYPPAITNITSYPNPQEINEYINISCDIRDDVEVKEARVNITLPNGSYENHTMLAGERYYYNKFCNLDGIYHYFILAMDTSNNTNKSAIMNFTIITPPEPPHIKNITVFPEEQQYGYPVNISCYAYDNVAVENVKLIVDNTTINMTGITNAKGNGWYYYNSTFSMGEHQFYINATDVNGYYNVSSLHFFNITDTIPPSISNITYPTLSQPGMVNISCFVTDNRGIKKVFLNISGGTSLNISMNESGDLFYSN